MTEEIKSTEITRALTLTAAEIECITDIVTLRDVTHTMMGVINKKLIDIQKKSSACRHVQLDNIRLIKIGDEYKFRELEIDIQTKIDLLGTLQNSELTKFYGLHGICLALIEAIKGYKWRDVYIANTDPEAHAAIDGGVTARFHVNSAMWIFYYLTLLANCIYIKDRVDKKLVAYKNACRDDGNVAYCQLTIHTLVNNAIEYGHACGLVFDSMMTEFFDPNGMTPGYEWAGLKPFLDRAFNEPDIINVSVDFMNGHGVQSMARADERITLGICGLFTVMYIYQRVRTVSQNAVKTWQKTTPAFYPVVNSVEDLLIFARKVLMTCTTTSGNLLTDLCQVYGYAERNNVIQKYNQSQSIEIAGLNVTYMKIVLIHMAQNALATKFT